MAFYKTIKILLSKMKDGHLYCSLPPAIETYHKEKALFFPIKLRFIDRKVYVDVALNPQIPIGAEILSIDNQPIKSVTTELMQYIVADGNIQTKKHQILNNFFYFYYFIAFGEAPSFKVSYKLKNGQIQHQSVNANLEKNVIGGGPVSTPSPLLDFSIQQKDIALITIKTFDPVTLKTDFNDFLAATFKKINELKVKKLIIDLRGNGGGKDTYGSLLYSYLAKKPFRYYKSLQTTTKELDYDQFKSSVSSYNDLRPSMLKKIGEGRYELQKEAHTNLEMIPTNHAYNGKVWFLIDGLSFSTTAEFCAIANSNKRGDFIGEETGGTYNGNTSGIEAEIVLPNTKMELSFGTVKYQLSVNRPKEIGRGIMPQYKIQPTIEDIINKRDAQLNYALWLAQVKNN